MAHSPPGRVVDIGDGPASCDVSQAGYAGPGRVAGTPRDEEVKEKGLLRRRLDVQLRAARKPNWKSWPITSKLLLPPA